MLKQLKEKEMSKMLQQYFSIIIKDNLLDKVSEIDEDKYNYFAYIFDYVYHTKNGETYQMHKNFDAGIDMLIVDRDHLYELLDDLKTEGFCYTDNLGGEKNG